MPQIFIKLPFIIALATILRCFHHLLNLPLYLPPTNLLASCFFPVQTLWPLVSAMTALLNSTFIESLLCSQSFHHNSVLQNRVQTIQNTLILTTFVSHQEMSTREPGALGEPDGVLPNLRSCKVPSPRMSSPFPLSSTFHASAWASHHLESLYQEKSHGSFSA